VLVFLFASLGMGCVDLTTPWDKRGPDARVPVSHSAADARGPDRVFVDDGGTPGTDTIDANGDDPANDTSDANGASPEVAVDEDQRADLREGGGLDEPPVDARVSDGDARDDTPIRPVDGSGDLAPDVARTDADAASAKQDGSPGLNPDLRESGQEDLPVETGDTASPRDVGREVIEIPGLVAYYPCESANGDRLPDTSGHDKNATLANGPTPTGRDAGPIDPGPGFGFGPGKIGNALTLSARDNNYVSLPTGLLSQLKEVTLATWVKLTSSLAYQRIFDFGMDTNTFMYLANSNGSGSSVRFRIVSADLATDQALEGGDPVPVGQWTHVVLTLGNDGISIFFDGTRVAHTSTASLRPSDLGNTVNNFIGRSPFPSDPYLDGQIDDFRIYDRVLSAVEIGELAGGQ
jgi:hypothetical protein